MNSKSIGREIERGVCEGLGLDHVWGDEYFDAVVLRDVKPGLIDPPFEVRFVGIDSILPGSQIEIKACATKTSNGEYDTTGRWLFKGNREGQHRKLTESNSFYALVVYDDEIEYVVLTSAYEVSEWIEDSWYSVDRCENTVAKLSWNSVIGDSDTI